MWCRESGSGFTKLSPHAGPTAGCRGQEGPARPLASACIAMVGQCEVREREVSEGIRNGWILVLKDVGFRGT